MTTFKPILFSIPMVKAILDGTKNQTRRIIKPQPDEDGLAYHKKLKQYHDTSGMIYKPKAEVGDIIVPCVRIYEDYMVSYNGDAYSLKYNKIRKIKPCQNKKGYLGISISNKNKKTTKHLHTLICEAFNGEKPNKSSQVRHLDGNPKNNIASNLKWGTQIENWQDRKAHGNGLEGEKHHNSIFSDIEREHIKWAVEKNISSQNNLARLLNTSQSVIHHICNDQNKITPTEVDISNKSKPLFLEITNVRFERVQDISEADSKAEGILSYYSDLFKEHRYKDYMQDASGHGHPDHDYPERREAKSSFKTLWESINGAESWKANPWVFVYNFRVIEKPENFH